MQSILEKMAGDYMEDSKRLSELEKHMEAKQGASSFYLMIAEKMSTFTQEQQEWMEDQIWQLYRQLSRMQGASLPMPNNVANTPLPLVPTASSTQNFGQMPNPQAVYPAMGLHVSTPPLMPSPPEMPAQQQTQPSGVDAPSMPSPVLGSQQVATRQRERSSFAALASCMRGSFEVVNE